MDELTEIFKALGDKNRFRIVMMLSLKKLCVCEITEGLGLAVSTVSKHLSILKYAGIIQDEKEGKWVNYFLDTDFLEKHGDILQTIKSKAENDKIIVRDRNLLKVLDRVLICSTDKK